jgi:hypothetical protein
MILMKPKVTGNRKRKHWIAIHEDLDLEEAMNLS